MTVWLININCCSSIRRGWKLVTFYSKTFVMRRSRASSRTGSTCLEVLAVAVKARISALTLHSNRVPYFQATFLSYACLILNLKYSPPR
uniref:Uncharacterized protein n=1 Tax=Octopus bimaculoides TaxID=37653 RepID=A0A0L8IFV3_OCTBM